MAFQVGEYCYGDLASAGQARCDSVAPAFAISSTNQLVAVQCVSSDAVGALTMRRDVWSSAGVLTTRNDVMTPGYPACRETLQWDAALAIFASALAAWAVVWGLWRVHRMVNAYRGGDAA